MSSKHELRRQQLERRQSMTHLDVVSSSLKALGFLKPLLPKNQWIGLYVPIKNELDPSLLFNQWTCLPSVEEGKLVFRAYQEPLVDGAFSTSISTGSVVFPSVIVVPGLAFDVSGGRLGYGKGYYDAYLTDQHCKIGFVHHSLMKENIVVEAHDVRMNVIVTDQGIIEVHPCTP
jgi:5-formyltetrahydrofolate cyclo-ligase